MSDTSIYYEINEVTQYLISIGLSIDQNFPSIQRNRSSTVINWGSAENLSIVFKNIDYKDIYAELDKNRNFNIKFIDGALLQFMYTFKNGELVSHRLAFFPSPDLESYQNDPEIYENDEIYADILRKNIVPVPIRFDYNCDEDKHIEVDHAKSHVTIGQYKNCRIPAAGPLNPTLFVEFILRNFYSTAYRKYGNTLRQSSVSFQKCITVNEQQILHFSF